MKYMDVKQASEKWFLRERRITALCRDHRIEGAYKEGKKWYIPQNAEAPIDGRTTEARMRGEASSHLPLPIGISDFREAVSNYYYVDKTLLIRDFLDTIPKVSLFTRPRRFGKTLNMDMLKVFFEKTNEDTSIYFKDKKIWTCGEKYREYQGKYPVIFLSFKDVKFNTWTETEKHIAYILRNEYDRHTEVMTENVCSDAEKEFFFKILDGAASETELTSALRELSRMLDKYYKKAPIIIIDEYDTPIQQGYTCGFYEESILFMRNLFSGAFKDNPHLSYGFLTGILRVAKESIFSGLNNLKENSIFDERYSSYFGFTNEEILSMSRYYGCEDKFDELCTWYDGYYFGKTEIFNPWSVINYFDDQCTPKAFWQSTGSNEIIREIVAQATPEIQKNLQLLMQGESISTYIDTSVIYPEIKKNPSTVYSFLLMAGYLKHVPSDVSSSALISIYQVAIPNKEIFHVFEREILSAMENVISPSTALSIQQAIIQQNVPDIQIQLETFLRQSISYFDGESEGFYHGLVLGISAIMNNLYRVTSNRESGEGRYDIQMEPYNRNLPGIIIELKLLKNKKSAASLEEIKSQLKELAKDALMQIQYKRYDEEMKTKGISSQIKIGLAFYKKNCEIEYQINE